jgi:hypothetical protein
MRLAWGTKLLTVSWTVHVVVGMDPDNRLWLLDLWRGRTASDAWVDALCGMILKWKPTAWAEEQGQIKAGMGPVP